MCLKLILTLTIFEKDVFTQANLTKCMVCLKLTIIFY